MPEDVVIARNRDGDPALPHLLRIPLGACSREVTEAFARAHER